MDSEDNNNYCETGIYILFVFIFVVVVVVVFFFIILQAQLAKNYKAYQHNNNNIIIT